MSLSPILPRVALLGGCHRDVIARSSGRFEPGTSCPGTIVDRPGGVARNVARLLAGAGLEVSLASRVGDDAAGRAVLADLASAGVDVDPIAIDPAARTGTYVAVHDRDGELAAAVSDMAIYDAITPAALGAWHPMLAAADLVFADANLPEATIEALAEACGGRLALDAISRAKAPRILPGLRAGALVFTNLAAAEVLVGRPVPSTREAAEALADVGADRAVVTGGPQPVAILSHGRVTLRPVAPVEVVDVTGAGDALIAGTLAGLAHGRPIEEAVDCGIAAAAAALASAGALDRLPPDVVDAISPSQTGKRVP